MASRWQIATPVDHGHRSEYSSLAGLFKCRAAEDRGLMNLLTVVSAEVDETRADELVGAFEALLAEGLPDGLLATQLLGDGRGHWAIHSLWRDADALAAMRAAPEPPAAPALFRRFSGEPTLAIMTVHVDSRVPS
jgi:hypothetical protein